MNLKDKENVQEDTVKSTKELKKVPEVKDIHLNSFAEFKHLISCQSPNPGMFDETKT